MNSHLTVEQISAWALGERSQKTEDHILVCMACQAELTGLQATLRQFRSSVREWSSERFDVDQFDANAGLGAGWHRRAAYPALCWAVAVLVMALALSLSMRGWLLQPVPAYSSVSDATLLNQVNREISRSVPGPMEPLTRLVSWDEGAR
jgi:hypothetical protein